MALSDFKPTFRASASNQEIVLTPELAVVWEIDADGVKYCVNILENYRDILVLPPNTISPGWKGRHIGWTAHADATIVRDDRFCALPR
jgi:hypothetical protein